MLAKICGLTNAEDALMAARSGADFLGLIFVEGSKRCVSVEQARVIIEKVRVEFGRDDDLALRNFADRRDCLVENASMLKSRRSKSPLIVGVFQNEMLDKVNDAVRELQLDLVQLHGDETPAYCQAVIAPTIKVIGIESRNTLDDIWNKIKHTTSNLILLDTKTTQASGGVGKTFDWSIACDIHRIHGPIPFILAGGLNPGNIEAAVDCKGPFAVDVSSGVERAPRFKDPDLMTRFLAATGNRKKQKLNI